MKTSKKLFIVASVVLATLLILVSPVLADPRSLVCNGDDACRFNFFDYDPQEGVEYPAGQPFFIFHGTCNTPSEDRIGLGHAGFALQLDDEYISPDWISHGATSNRKQGWNWVCSFSAFNFPEGLQGEHTLTGHWYTGCYPITEICTTPIQPIVTYSRQLNVKFNGP